MKKLYNYFNERTKKLNLIDLKLIQIGTLLLGIIVAILFPIILKINLYLLNILFVLSFIVPIYKFFLKK